MAAFTWIGDKMWAWFEANFLPWLSKRFGEILSFFHKHFTKEMVVLYMFWGFATGVASLMYWAYTTAFTSFMNLAVNELPKLSSGLLPYFRFMDRFLPLTEVSAGLVVLWNVWLVIIVLRWVKSFIPLISN